MAKTDKTSKVKSTQLPQRLTDALPRVQLFRNVKQSDIEELLWRCECRELTVGEVLLSPKVDNQHLYIVLSGKLVVHLENHITEALCCVDPGECVGELSSIDNKLPAAIVSATKDSYLLVVDKEILLQMTQASHQVSLNLIHILVSNVRFCNKIIADSFESKNNFQRYATIDALTGLHNRGWLDEMYNREVERSIRNGDPASLIMIDVDHFKQYNDDHGHQAGDQVLRVIGDTLRIPLRPNDMIARYGGEEFSVLLPNTKIDEALNIAERLRTHIEKMDIGELNNRHLPAITISLGVACNHASTTLTQMLKQADDALYKAKQQGRNEVVRAVACS